MLLLHLFKFDFTRSWEKWRENLRGISKLLRSQPGFVGYLKAELCIEPDLIYPLQFVSWLWTNTICTNFGEDCTKCAQKKKNLKLNLARKV